MPILNWSDCEQTRKAKTAVPFRLLKESQRLSYGDKNSGNLFLMLWKKDKQGRDMDAQLQYVLQSS